MIKKPMLAETAPSLSDAASVIRYPVAATPKLDGIRAVKVNGAVVSRSFKPIPNILLRQTLESFLPDGADGEIMYGKTFQECTSAIMSHTFTTNKKQRYAYYWFDYVKDTASKPYTERMNDIKAFMTNKKKEILASADIVIEIVPLYPIMIHTSSELTAYENNSIKKGYEGVIIRSPMGKYKFGRSTLKEGLMLKIKRFKDAEAIVVGVEELLHNHNEVTTDALGRTQRSNHRENKTASGKLGALVVEDAGDRSIQFKIGTGFTDKERAQMWKQRKSLIGKYAKYKSMEFGVKDAPRHPVFLGFRHVDDL
jgi:DNA ligase-1